MIKTAIWRTCVRQTRSETMVVTWKDVLFLYADFVNASMTPFKARACGNEDGCLPFERSLRVRSLSTEWRLRAIRRSRAWNQQKKTYQKLFRLNKTPHWHYKNLHLENMSSPNHIRNCFFVWRAREASASP